MDNPKIFSALCAAMSEIGAIGKEQHNKQQDFNYRGVDAVMNALQPVLIKNHIFVIPEVTEQTREERTTKSGSNLLYSILKVKYTFFAEDGSSVSAIVIGEGMDSGDKASNKAMSVAFKYACFQVLCIPTEEMKDPDSETPEPSTKSKSPDKETRHHDLFCDHCGKEIGPMRYKGKDMTAQEVADQFGLCFDCLKSGVKK